MKLSARNQFKGTVVAIDEGAVNGIVKIDIGGGNVMSATISMAAIRELGIHSPLCEAGLGKSEIRNLSQDLLLPTWNKPSMACLASRFVYGETITKDQLKMVERAEELLHLLGFRQYRVRIHGGSLARIEVEPEEIHQLLPLRGQIHTAFRQLGFSFVTVDLGGYRTGSMNEAIGIQ